MCQVFLVTLSRHAHFGGAREKLKGVRGIRSSTSPFEIRIPFAMQTPSELAGMARALAALDYGAETDVLDYKGACEWDGHTESAKLAKDIVAFANHRGGGTLIIGVAETVPGKFLLEGLTAKQLDSFDATDMAKWINSRFTPPVRFAVFKPGRDMKSFVVVFVNEFDDMPSICTKEFQVPGEPPLLRRGAIYVRSVNSESKQLDTPDELRRLVGAATARTGAVLLSQVQALLSGRVDDATSQKSPPDVVDIDRMLEKSLKLNDTRGLWTCGLSPLESIKPLFNTVSEARTFLRQSESRYFGWHYPIDVEKLHAQEWGTANLGDDEGFGLSFHGTYRARSVRRSEAEDVKNIRGEVVVNRSTYVEFHETLYGCAGRIQFLSNLAATFPPETPIQLEYGATQLNGRTLISIDPSVRAVHCKECVADNYSWKREDLTAGEFAAGWIEYATEIAFRLMLLMNFESISRDVVKNWMERYQSRRR